MLRQGSAALLNAIHPDVDFPATVCEIRELMRDAFAGVISFDDARNVIGIYNAAHDECGCTFTGGIPTTYECPGDLPLEPCEGDVDGDGDVDLDDYLVFADCINGPIDPTPVDDCLYAFDFDEDGDVDLADFDAFQNAFATP